MSNPVEQRKAVRESIDGVLAKITELETTITDFNGDNPALNLKLNEYTASLQSLHTAGMALLGRNGAPYEVPVELLTYIDDGGNPDAFIIDVIRSAAVANEAAKGKVEAFRTLKEGLLEDIQSQFPEIIADYKALRPAGKQEEAKEVAAAAAAKT
ncbi:hypothetical protein Ndes2526B_g00522 [Nannochloris sp. 'desiccata']|nr:hypothetical protein KSW81_003835 [Chlorella desiccata (nom. nud.)]KAH7624333.1 putative Mediator of RNA polymerase II transcription subunit 10b [Chlorella desiccata (nom. nud.)]